MFGSSVRSSSGDAEEMYLVCLAPLEVRKLVIPNASTELSCLIANSSVPFGPRFSRANCLNDVEGVARFLDPVR